MDRFITRTRPAQQARQPLAVASTNSPISRREVEATEPSPKRRKVDNTRKEKTKIDASDDEYEPQHVSDKVRGKQPMTARDDDEEDPDEPSFLERENAFESSFPDVKSGKDAIEEYETLRASQVEEEQTADNTASRLDERKWVRGKSSIYVDAFNLALDTVLEDEKHLFDHNEMEVFKQWEALDYEAQYLYLDHAVSESSCHGLLLTATQLCPFVSAQSGYLAPGRPSWIP
jgi:Fanconi-associated nuclease 1